MDVWLVLDIPVKKQKQCIDLVVIAGMGKREELILEIGKLGCFARKQNTTRFETALVTAQPGFFVGIRPATHDIEKRLLFQQLDQPHAAAGILDDHEVDAPLRDERGDLLAHLHNSPMAAADLEDVEGHCHGN
jgi:hypothetical protein